MGIITEKGINKDTDDFLKILREKNERIKAMTEVMDKLVTVSKLAVKPDFDSMSNQELRTYVRDNNNFKKNGI